LLFPIVFFRLSCARDPEINNGKLEVSVTHQVPEAVMGSGLGRNHVSSGDYDINLFCEETVEEYGLEDLRLGNIAKLMKLRDDL